jgi:hypothetical protein
LERTTVCVSYLCHFRCVERNGLKVNARRRAWFRRLNIWYRGLLVVYPCSQMASRFIGSAPPVRPCLVSMMSDAEAHMFQALVYDRETV